MDDLFLTQWSTSFLNKSGDLIKSLSRIPRNYTIVKTEEKQLKPIPQDLLLRTFLSTPVEQLGLPVLYEQCLSEIKPKIKTLSDFHYFINHLPFQRELLIALCQLSPADPFHKQYIMCPYISPVIQSWLFGHGTHLATYQCTTAMGFKLSVDFVDDNDRGNDTDSYLKQICFLVDTIVYLYQIPLQTSTIHIVCALSPFVKGLNLFRPNRDLDQVMIGTLKRYMPDLEYNYTRFNNPITSLTINSGATTKDYILGNFIVLWRHEEMQKVLVHELIHYFNLEKGNGIPFLPVVNVSTNFPHYTKELFTELQTWYIYVLVCTVVKDLDLHITLERERLHSLCNLCRLFRHYQITRYDQFVDSSNDPHTVNVCSSVLYYSVYKTLLLMNVNHIIEELMLPSPSPSPFSEINQQMSAVLSSTMDSKLLKVYIDTFLEYCKPLSARFTMMCVEM
jgi:hypothetical protein